jgi:Arc/MetJ-type ribon-helix-helix transcriptional regulator
MSSKIINISLPAELVKKIDAAAKANYASRSDFIRESVVRRLRRDQVDTDYPISQEFDDGSGEVWRTVVDFRDKNHPDGVPVEEVIATLEEQQEDDRQKQKTASKT